MRRKPSDIGSMFYARLSDADELGGIKVDFGVAAVLMELDAKGDVWRFVGVDDDGKPLFRWPSRRVPPFDFAGRYPRTSMLQEYLIGAAEFEAKWAEATALDEGR